MLLRGKYSFVYQIILIIDGIKVWFLYYSEFSHKESVPKKMIGNQKLMFRWMINSLSSPPLDIRRIWDESLYITAIIMPESFVVPAICGRVRSFVLSAAARLSLLKRPSSGYRVLAVWNPITLVDSARFGCHFFYSLTKTCTCNRKQNISRNTAFNWICGQRSCVI